MLCMSAAEIDPPWYASPEMLTLAIEEISRRVNSDEDISREKIPTGVPPRAMFDAMFSARAVFPIDGRAARTKSVPGLSPPVMALSRSSKPVGIPMMPLLAGFMICVM